MTETTRPLLALRDRVRKRKSGPYGPVDGEGTVTGLRTNTGGGICVQVRWDGRPALRPGLSHPTLDEILPIDALERVGDGKKERK